MQTLAEIRTLLAQRGLSPKKSLGQNFLIDHNLIRRLVDAAAIEPGDRVLEIGPGTGALTIDLLERGATVVASELDDGLAALLADTLGGAYPETFTLVHGDCLAGKRSLAAPLLAAIGDQPFKLVANLPYGAATPLILTLLADHPACGGVWVTIQREVVDRLAASPGTKAYGSISVVAQAIGSVERLATLPPGCFWPQPGVTSAMVAIKRRDDPLTDNPRRLADFCQEAFAQRRKQLGPSLKRLGYVPKQWPDGVDPTDRIESLSPEIICHLERACRS
ncbi:MAG: ribosomal RNA small subunit methyltransferase A [Phycisphaerae bacterium]|nr:ribosomal RNA small subunit methyltransferase A [Phycisphaerae bacterium]